jgi:hypothetical protein
MKLSFCLATIGVLVSLLPFPKFSRADNDARTLFRNWQVKVDQILDRGGVVGIKSYVQNKLITDKVVKLHRQFGAIEVPNFEGTEIAVVYNADYYARLDRRISPNNHWYITEIASRKDEQYQQKFGDRVGALVVPTVLTGIYFTTAIEEQLTVQNLGSKECDGVICQVFILESASWKARVWFWNGDSIPKRIDVLRSSKGDFTRTVLFREWIETKLGQLPQRILVYRTPIELQQEISSVTPAVENVFDYSSIDKIPKTEEFRMTYYGITEPSNLRPRSSALLLAIASLTAVTLLIFLIIRHRKKH